MHNYIERVHPWRNRETGMLKERRPGSELELQAWLYIDRLEVFSIFV